MDYRKQAAINSIGSVVLMFGQWLISVLLVRMSGYEDAGVFSLAMTVSNVFSYFANYGLRNYQVADVQGRFAQGQYILARVLTSGAAILACGGYLLLAGGYAPAERAAIALYLLYSIVNIFSDTLLGTLQLHDRLYLNGYSNVLRGTLCFLVFVGSYFFLHDLLVALGAMAAATLVLTLLFDWGYYRKVEPVSPWKKSDLRASLCLLRTCFALMISTILPVITTALPRRSIQKLAGTEQLGYFSSIFTPTVLITTLVPAIIIALVPRIARAWNEGDRRGLASLIAQTYGLAVGFLLAAELAALVCGRWVMQLVFGPEILQYYGLLYWAILATGINALTCCGNGILVAIGGNRAVAVGSAAALVVTLCLSDLLVKSWGINGAAYVLTAAYLVQAGVQMLALGAKWRAVGRQGGRPEGQGGNP